MGIYRWFLLKQVFFGSFPLAHLVTRGGFHALIDTGALITGLSNKEVAVYLLGWGFSWGDEIGLGNTKESFFFKDSRLWVIRKICSRLMFSSVNRCFLLLIEVSKKFYLTAIKYMTTYNYQTP